MSLYRSRATILALDQPVKLESRILFGQVSLDQAMGQPKGVFQAM